MTSKRLAIQAKAYHEDGESLFSVNGKDARALLALIDAKKNGVTALEISSWALRLASYVHRLRSIHGLDIRTEREKHDGGWHGRYVLLTPVEILTVIQ